MRTNIEAFVVAATLVGMITGCSSTPDAADAARFDASTPDGAAHRDTGADAPDVSTTADASAGADRAATDAADASTAAADSASADGGGSDLSDAAALDGTRPRADASGDRPLARPTHCLLVAVGSDTWLLRDDGTNPIVLMDARHAQYTADGSAIVYGRDGAIRKRNNDGSDEQVVLAAPTGADAYHPTDSPGGDRIAYIHDDSGNRSLRIKEYAGPSRMVNVALPGETIETIGWPRWSPAGDRIALWFETRAASGDNIKRLMVVNPDGTSAQVVTNTQTDIERGDWTSDGTKLVHETDDKAIGWTDISTQQTRALFRPPDGSVDDPVVSADGKGILYRKSPASGASELRLATLDAGGTVTRDALLLSHQSELAPVDWNPACK